MSVTDQAKQGYCAVKLAFGKTANIKKPANGQLKKAGIKTPLRFFREMRVDESAIVEDQDKRGWTVGETTMFVGDIVKPNTIFKKGDKVDVTGTSKGKGFQGGVRRHGFAGGPKTHGQSDRWRAPGSIGQTTTPGRVYKGKRMAGRMGGDRVTVKGLEVIDVTDTGLTIKGLVPGAQTGLLQIRSSQN
jgi:large subunit ribosomal protein L3